MKVALIQASYRADFAHNRHLNTQAIEQACVAGAELIVLPELQDSVYFCQTVDRQFFAWAADIPNETTDWLSQLARRFAVVIIGSVFERRAAGIYHNTAVVLDADGQLVGRYRKMHIPNDPNYYEKYYFTAGDLGFQPIQTQLGKLGILICWDQWFPEAARLMALAGAEILIYPTAIGWDLQDNKPEQQRQSEAWLTVQRGHAIANQLPVVCANRCGFEADPSGHTTGIQFWGQSFICGQQGEILAQADSQTTQYLLAEVDLTQTETLRQVWTCFRDRRVDAYAGLTALSLEENPKCL